MPKPTASSLFRCFWWSCLGWLLLAAAPLARAQCAPAWASGDGLPGVDGPVLVTRMWDPDGAGPATPVLVVGGNFTLAGNLSVSGLATYDPGTGAWGRLGSFGPGMVTALAVLPNGDLCAGGLFGVARWNGATWAPLGNLTGLYVQVLALATLANGDLVAGGVFSVSGGQFVGNLARWNGSAWVALGGGVVGTVNALAVLPNGDLVVGGNLTMAGSVPANRIALWNGANWSTMAGGMDGEVLALLALANGDLLAGGRFAAAGGTAARSIARWQGTAWSALGSGLPQQVFGLAQCANGDLVAAGEFYGSSAPAPSPVSIWRGAAWTDLGAGLQAMGARCVAELPGGDLVAGGQSFSPGRALRIARWNGSDWQGLARGMNGPVLALGRLANGDLVAGGAFTGAGAVAAGGVARWNGSTWSAFGAGVSGSTVSGKPARVFAVATLPNGDLVVGGNFTMAGGVPANHVARWNGTSWAPLGAGVAGPAPFVFALAVLPNGDLVAGGQFVTAGGVAASNLARWDGAVWAPLGAGTSSDFPLTPGQVEALLVLPNGDLVAAGGFNLAGGSRANHIARWDGSTWSPFGAGMDRALYALALLPNGDLLAGGAMTTAGNLTAAGVARWDGAAWSGLHSGIGTTVRALAVLPNGDVLAGGAAQAYRYDGQTWTPGGPGPTSIYGQPAVSAMQLLPSGAVVFGGAFMSAGGTNSVYLATLAPTCPATAVANGTGCSGSNGPNVLAAESLPWVGSTCRARAIGLPSQGLALDLIGLGTVALPLAQVLPQGGPGCVLQVDALVCRLGVPSGGQLQAQISIPNAVAFAGVVLHQQVLPLELDALGLVTAATSTNALQWTIGAL
ncbi:MAG: hypothetical protein JNK49_17340 [Planctomycetes bacterium]|nr:hypothetical protein [Planctomycetota bacterium]